MLKVKLTGRESYLWDGEELYVFARNGSCQQEKAPPLAVATLGLVCLPILSIISTNGKTVVAWFYREEQPLQQRLLEEDARGVVFRLQRAKGFLRMLTRSGIVEGCAFNQMLFVYSEAVSMEQYWGIALGLQR